MRFKKIKLCHYCRKELVKDYGLHSFCSSWCKEQKELDAINFKKHKPKKAKVPKIRIYKPKPPRKCNCGKDLKWHRQLCDDCLSKPYEYTICDNPCKNCGGKVSSRLHKKYVKLFCEAKCAKEYYYKLKKEKQYENLG